MSARVYKFGLLAPDAETRVAVLAQMRGAHAYQNKLVELDRVRRVAVRRAESAAVDAALVERVTLLKSELDAAIGDVRASRAASRSRSETGEQTERVRAARESLKVARFALHEARKAARANPAFGEAKDAAHEAMLERRRAERAACGVYWGTYQLAEESAQQASSVALWDDEQPMDPRFRRWSGEGRVSVQFVKGAAYADVTNGRHTQLQIEPPNELAWNGTRGERRRASRTRIRLRIGSDGVKPVWAEWPMIMHRPLPGGCTIKRGTVSLRRVGPREIWSLELTISLAESWQHEPCGAGAVGVDLGWRLRPNGDLRVAVWADEHGATGEFVVPAEVSERIRYADQLRGTRDVSLDAIRAALRSWLDALDSKPEWISEATGSLWQWKSPARFASLAKRWASNRFAGDEDAYTLLAAWRYHDHHLWEWETSQRRKAILRRTELYRCFAAWLARKYATVALEEFDLAKMATMTAEVGVGPVRRNRQATGVGQLRTCITQAFAARRGESLTVSAVLTTRTCSECGARVDFDAAAYVTAVCPNGHAWDQDENAAKNILERRNDAPEPRPARKRKKGGENAVLGETRWARARRMRAEKETRMHAAREPGATAAE